MSKSNSKAYLNQKKAHELGRANELEVRFMEISKAVMKRKNMNTSRLEDFTLEELKFATKYWEHLLNEADDFLKNNK